MDTKFSVFCAIFVTISFGARGDGVMEHTAFHNADGSLQTRNAFQGRHCYEKFSHIGNHSACLSPSPSLVNSGVNDTEKEIIVREHNKYRGMVKPPASNMLKLTWDDEIAMIAQAWADTCPVGHDSGEHRNIPGRLSLGQNYGRDYPDWSSCIKAWFDENKKFVYDVETSFHDVGHYTQVVWADTTKIGCGFAECQTSENRRRTFLVCNYGPMGNLGGYKTPYKTGSTCSACPHTCKNNLCDCGEKVCLNGATMNRRNCTCSCNQPFQVGDACQLNCSSATYLEVKASSCGQKPFDKNGCFIYGNAPNACPVLCGQCPYGDIHYKDADVALKRPGLVSSSTHAQYNVIVFVCCMGLVASLI